MGAVNDNCSNPCLEPSSAGLSFIDLIDPDIVQSSVLLSTIAEGEWRSGLPDVLSTSDFRLWITAKQLLRRKPKRLEFPFIELCVAAKVADFVGDRDLKALTDQIVQNLTHLLKFDTWGKLPDGEEYVWDVDEHRLEARMQGRSFREHFGAANIETALQGLSLLPDEVLHQVFTASDEHEEGDGYYICPLSFCLLEILPVSMYSSVLRAMSEMLIESDTLYLRWYRYYNQCLSALTAILPSDCPFSHLIVGKDWEIDRDSYVPTCWSSSVAEALVYQTGITRLTLEPGFYEFGFLEELVKLPSCLQSIQRLTLDDSFYGDEGTYKVLRDIFQNAPSLQDLMIEELHNSIDFSPVPGCAHTSAGLLEAVCAATSLTKLDIGLKCGMQESLLLPSSVRCPPHLSDLKVRCLGSKVPVEFLDTLGAHVTNLDITAYLTESKRAEESDQGITDHYFISLANMTSLKSLRVNVSLDFDGDGFSFVPRLDAVRAVATSLVDLPQLSHLRLNLSVLVYDKQACAAMIVECFSSLPGGCPALQTVQFGIDPDWGENALEALVKVFCNIPSLKHMQLMMRGGWIRRKRNFPYQNLSFDGVAVQTDLTAVCTAADVSISFVNEWPAEN